MNIFYAARKEGVFESADAALQRAELTPRQIAWAKTNAQINGGTSVWFPVNEDFGALVTPSDDGFVLWRAFYGEDWRGSVEDAMAVIRTFVEDDCPGPWAVFEYVPLEHRLDN